MIVFNSDEFGKNKIFVVAKLFELILENIGVDIYF